MANKSSFGQAWSCVSDLSSPGVMVTGNRVVAEAIARRLQTRRGGLIDDSDYGFDLTAYLDADLSAADIALIQSNVQAECVKDERVSGATATVNVMPGGVLVTSIVVTTSNGPFTLVLATSAVTTTLLQVNP